MPLICSIYVIFDHKGRPVSFFLYTLSVWSGFVTLKAKKNQRERESVCVRLFCDSPLWMLILFIHFVHLGSPFLYYSHSPTLYLNYRLSTPTWIAHLPSSLVLHQHPHHPKSGSTLLSQHSTPPPAAAEIERKERKKEKEVIEKERKGKKEKDDATRLNEAILQH